MKKSFRRKEVTIADGVVVAVRELSHKEHGALIDRIYESTPDGRLTPRKGVDYAEQWLVATIDPGFAAEEIREWPEALLGKLLAEAQAVNAAPVEDAAKNS